MGNKTYRVAFVDVHLGWCKARGGARNGNGLWVLVILCPCICTNECDDSDGKKGSGRGPREAHYRI